MHDNHELVAARLRRAIEQRIQPALYGERSALRLFANELPGEPVPFTEAIAGTFRPFDVGSSWGKPWGTVWFQLVGRVPEHWTPGTYEVVFDLGFAPHSVGFQAEAAVWEDAGGPRSSVHPMRRNIAIPKCGPGDEVMLYVEAASNPGFMGTMPTPMGSRSTAGDRNLYRVREADIAVLHREVQALLLDIEILDGTMRGCRADEPRRHQIVRAMERMLDALDLEAVVDTAARARAELADALAPPARASAHNIVAVGHAHIDSAWLWPLRETVRKCSRTFSSALALMDDYPEFRFVCSQAAQYDWMERRFPSVFEGIRAKVATGQWQPVGGMWVEADMNLPSGESIARQLIHGQRYFEDRFGVRCREVWIPDVFGYPGSLPQIFAAGGCDRFVTQKLSWNKQNKMPHHTFDWYGIDGTPVLTHFPPVDSYNAEIVTRELVHAERNFSEKAWSNWSLMPFGYGNGGGGPSREMLERARRVKDLDGLPRVEIGTTDSFFAAVDAERQTGDIPQWHGELYFETHRGTLTTQANTKGGNRTCERLLREAELWWSVAAIQHGAEYPQATFDAIWKEVLLLQFHDIIPGSSIAWVYEDTDEAYGRLIPQLETLVASALDLLAPATATVANAATHRRDEVVASSLAPRGDGPTQVLADGTTAFMVSVPGLALADAVAIDSGDAVTMTGNSMRNAVVAIEWNEWGELSSIRDLRADRELLTLGSVGARLELGRDLPNEYDAWDLESWARDTPEIVQECDHIDVIDAGPLVGKVRVSRSFGPSTLSMTYIVHAGSPRVDIDFDIDWHHDERILSVAFPIDVHTPHVECGIQFGSVTRPRYGNTTWDAAKFEVCAHRWVDVSEPNFGVAVLNNGRYGHAVQGDAIRVSLLRSPKWPDPTADRGRHHTTVSVFPHGNDRCAVVQAADALNEPLRVVSGSARSVPDRLVSVTGDSVVASAVKLAEDGSGDLVVRVFESAGQRSPLGVSVGGHERINDVSLLEEFSSEGAAPVEHLRAFELRTLRCAR